MSLPLTGRYIKPEVDCLVNASNPHKLTSTFLIHLYMAAVPSRLLIENVAFPGRWVTIADGTITGKDTIAEFNSVSSTPVL
jgi:hypothetical protein